ncbi:MAG TPA: paraquat-inducible protein A [Steroidobacteraceae bacterium]|nr:paraquat-inducible protein A [Steroidobacteraceae bacterium]
MLSGRAAGRVDLPLALSAGALLLLFPAIFAPLLSVSTLGATRQGWLISGAQTFVHQGYWELASLVLTCAFALPFLYTGALTWVLGTLHFRREIPGSKPMLGWLYRWVVLLRPWMMIEVFLIGGFVAYTRIDAVASVEVEVGGWCLLAATLVLLLALTQVDDRTVWGALHPHTDEIPRSDEPADHAQTSVLARSGPLACTTCDLIVPATAEGSRCPRCLAPLHRRKPQAFRRTLALLLAGYLLYIPANLLPVLTLVQVGSVEHDTIITGVLELIRNDLWPLAVIVFVASIVLPLMKLLGLTWMLLAIQLRSGFLLRARTRLYRMIDLIGRWSNIDVFMGSVLVTVLQFGKLTSVRAGPGLVAFAAVVVITMFATLTFDARLMWDAARSRH